MIRSFVHKEKRMSTMIELKTRTFWQATIALGIASFLIFANIYFTQPLLPVFTEEFGISPVVSSLTVSLSLLTLGVSFFIYSALSDALGRKNIMMITMAISSVITFLTVFAPNFETLLVFRVLQAAALAGIPTIAMAYIGEEFSIKALTLAIGIHISCNSIGGMTGRFISGFFTDIANWRIAFLVLGIVSLILFVFFVMLLPPSKHFKPQEFNIKNTLKDYKEHLKNRTLRLAYYVGGFHFFVFTGLFNYVTYLLSGEPFNVSTTVLGFLFVTYLSGTFSSTLAGKLSQRMKQSTCMAIGIGFMVIGIVLTLITHVLFVILGLLFLCFGFFFAHSCSSAWVSQHAKFAKASASGLYLTSYYLVGSIGTVYLGYFWSHYGWSGVVIGCLLVLVFTSYCVSNMYRIERKALFTR